MSDLKKERRGMLLCDGIILAFVLAAKFLAIAMIDLLPDCFFARFGITCPSCGATRCIRELFSGNFEQAFALHPFLFCLCFYLAGTWLLLNIGYLLPQHHCQKTGRAMVGGRAIVILTSIYALFGITRMLLTLPV
jgi:hypothetical protein